MEPTDIAFVVIGRNEEKNLVRCLQSIREACGDTIAAEIIYVDSNSTDRSTELARSHQVQVLELGDTPPSAAAARNMGWKATQAQWVMFMDGDTALHPQFLQQALSTFRPEIAAVWGHRREVRPYRSVYARALDFDWVYPAGLTEFFGGDVLIRRSALESVGGYDPRYKAGEEPEMCARLSALDWKILHIDAAMTEHDLCIDNLRAWALRAYRSGMACAHLGATLGTSSSWGSSAARDRRHGMVYLGGVLLTPLLAWTAPAWWLLLCGVFLVIVFRTARRSRWKCPQWSDAWLYALHSHLQKIPALFGQWAWLRAYRHDRQTPLIEYRSSDKK